MKTLSHPEELFDFPANTPDLKLATDPEGYQPSRDLVVAFKIAQALKQPLLVTGDPGTGKTQLAHYVAHELGLGKPITFEAQTISTKTDLFYKYDALSHFQWAQVNRTAAETLTNDAFEAGFIRYEAIGEAIVESQKDPKKPRVVLIDEIDKAPRDLPNDLLAAIEEMTFTIHETPGQDKIIKKCTDENLRPIVIITSNSEKNLPDAFLRRVVYYHIPFPEEAQLLQILEKRTPIFAQLKAPQQKILIDYFLEQRNSGKLNKKPATAELIAWASLLLYLGFPCDKLKDITQCTAAELAILHSANSILGKTSEDLVTLNEAIKK
jgi:MoxR-like ATPase